MSITGVGPVISSGLLGYIDMERAPTVGHIWRYAGLDPTLEWLGKKKAETFFNEEVKKGKAKQEDLLRMAAKLNLRPEPFLEKMLPLTAAKQKAELAKPHHNADLKVLCWKIGECFKNFKNKGCEYGPLLDIRRNYENEKNARGEYAELAAKILREKNFGDNSTRKAYEEGRLPDGHLHARAKRYAVKMFLSHWHQVAHMDYFGRPAPKPFAIEILGHAHEIPVPNWPF